MKVLELGGAFVGSATGLRVKQLFIMGNHIPAVINAGFLRGVTTTTTTTTTTTISTTTSSPLF